MMVNMSLPVSLLSNTHGDILPLAIICVTRFKFTYLKKSSILASSCSAHSPIAMIVLFNACGTGSVLIICLIYASTVPCFGQESILIFDVHNQSMKAPISIGVLPVINSAVLTNAL